MIYKWFIKDSLDIPIYSDLYIINFNSEHTIMALGGAVAEARDQGEFKNNYN